MVILHLVFFRICLFFFFVTFFFLFLTVVGALAVHHSCVDCELNIDGFRFSVALEFDFDALAAFPAIAASLEWRHDKGKSSDESWIFLRGFCFAFGFRCRGWGVGDIQMQWHGLGPKGR